MSPRMKVPGLIYMATAGWQHASHDLRHRLTVSKIPNFGKYVAISSTWTLNAINSSKGASANVAGPVEKFDVGNVSDAPMGCTRKHPRSLLASDHTINGIMKTQNGSDLAGIRTFKVTDAARVRRFDHCRIGGKLFPSLYFDSGRKQRCTNAPRIELFSFSGLRDLGCLVNLYV